MGSTSIPVGSYSAAIVSVFFNDDTYQSFLACFPRLRAAIDSLSRAYASQKLLND